MRPLNACSVRAGVVLLNVPTCPVQLPCASQWRAGVWGCDSCSQRKVTTCVVLRLRSVRAIKCPSDSLAVWLRFYHQHHAGMLRAHLAGSFHKMRWQPHTKSLCLLSRKALPVRRHGCSTRKLNRSVAEPNPRNTYTSNHLRLLLRALSWCLS